MQSRKHGKERKGQQDALTDVISRVPRGHALYKSGVDEGLSWAASAKPREVAGYSALRHEDVVTQVQARVDAPDWLSLSISFPSGFEPPAAYDGGLPEASLDEDELAVRIFWMGWLDGVHEAEARKALAPLMAAIPARRVLVMDLPRPTECPICWIERNLGVKVVVKSDHETEEG